MSDCGWLWLCAWRWSTTKCYMLGHFHLIKPAVGDKDHLSVSSLLHNKGLLTQHAQWQMGPPHLLLPSLPLVLLPPPPPTHTHIHTVKTMSLTKTGRGEWAGVHFIVIRPVYSAGWDLCLQINHKSSHRLMPPCALPVGSHPFDPRWL